MLFASTCYGSPRRMSVWLTEPPWVRSPTHVERGPTTYPGVAYQHSTQRPVSLQRYMSAVSTSVMSKVASTDSPDFGAAMILSISGNHSSSFGGNSR